MSFQKKIWFGFVAAIVIIASLAIISYENNRKTRQSLEWVAHNNKVLYHSEQILALIVDLEAGQRGFALTGMESFLSPTLRASENVKEHVESLHALMVDNTLQQDRAKRLQALVAEKLEFTEKAIESRRKNGMQAAALVTTTLEGNRVTANIRALLSQIQDEEKKTLMARTQQVQSRITLFNQYFVAMLLVTGGILILLFYAIYQNSMAREKAQQSLKLALERVEDIYNHSPCGYLSLDANGAFIEVNNTFLSWLRYERDEIVTRFNFGSLLSQDSQAKFERVFTEFKKSGVIRDEQFEVIRKDGTSFFVLMNATASYDSNGEFLRSRTTILDYTELRKALQKIEQLNNELESFSYSVSHDLRAPLRSIDGYTQIMMEDYAGSFDVEGKRILQVIVNNARRMGRLIDDLLDFSRISRKELIKTPVNNVSLLQLIITELSTAEPERNVEVILRDIAECEADPALLRQVWYNLLSNAFKYTRKKEHPRIEVSSERRPGELVFQVKDNGTGFDMQYANKLFGVFQRLHRQNEFEGTGVGLAIVHRIISRHGGSVWATAEVDHGASFYFSLPVS